MVGFGVRGGKLNVIRRQKNKDFSWVSDESVP